MKTDKGYKGACMALQMFLIPVLLTLGFFLVANIIGNVFGTNLSELGRSAKNLIYILIAFFGSLFVGGIVGYIFSKKSKTKPEAARERYVAPLIAIIYALAFAVLAIVLSKGNYNSSWWGIYAFKNPIFLVLDFALAFMGLHFIIPIAELMGYSGFAIGMWLYEIISKTVIRNKSSINMAVLSAALFIAAVSICGIGARDIISNGTIELMYGKSTVGNDLTEFDLMDIAPFREKNGLAKLDKTASLQFKELDQMPRLDGATAAYPVYGAFVEAVYKGLGESYEMSKKSDGKDVYTAFVESDSYPFNIVKCSKTGKAYERLINGETDIIFVAEPSKGHLEAVKAKGDEFALTPIGSEAFVFFTNIKNPLEGLTIEQIQDIYSGKITNWKNVGGENKKIVAYQRPENSGSQTIMLSKVMKDVKMQEPTKETYAGGMGEIISEVAGYKNAKNSIGYSFMYYSSSMIKNNQIKYISVNGIKPTPETVRNKTYPFTVPVYAVTLKSNINENVSKLINWILSDEGQSLIEKTGYIPMR